MLLKLSAENALAWNFFTGSSKGSFIRIYREEPALARDFNGTVFADRRIMAYKAFVDNSSPWGSDWVYAYERLC